MRTDVVAIHEPTWAAMTEVLEAQRRGVTITPAEAAARAGLTSGAPMRSPAGGIRLIWLTGILTRRGSWLSSIFGGTSLDSFAAAVLGATADPGVSSIVIVVDSPGGEVSGTPEAADAVFAARQRKRVLAVGDGLVASAAYWIASQAQEVIAGPSSTIGSLGVVAVHVDESRAVEAAGLRPTIITSAKNKAEGTPLRPLDDAARAAWQSRVNEAGAMFTAAVARGRGVSAARARGPEFGEGRAFFADEARRRGLIDRVVTAQTALAGEVAAADDRVEFARAQRVYDNALALWLDLKARGLAGPRPRPPQHPDAARLRIQLAERGL